MFTTFLKRSIVPVALIMAGSAGGEVFTALALVGGIWEATVVAKLVDGDGSRTTRPRLKLPSLRTIRDARSRNAALARSYSEPRRYHSRTWK
jgi:hypothetical protein